MLVLLSGVVLLQMRIADTTATTTTTTTTAPGPTEILPVIVIKPGQVEGCFSAAQLQDWQDKVAGWNSEICDSSRKPFMLDGLGRNSGNGIDGTARPADAGRVFMILEL